MKQPKECCKICKKEKHPRRTINEIADGVQIAERCKCDSPKKEDSSPSSFEEKFPSLKNKINYATTNNSLIVDDTFILAKEVDKNCLDKSIVERDYCFKKDYDSLMYSFNSFLKTRIEKQKVLDFLNKKCYCSLNRWGYSCSWCLLKEELQKELMKE